MGLIMFFPLWFTQKSWLIYFDLVVNTETGQMGDTFGGLMAPYIAMVAAGLTFMAFWVQYIANQNQRHDIQVERFENKFYEMLRLHRDNVTEVEIAGNHNGRKAFIKMYEEFRYCYFMCHELLNSTDGERKWKKEEIDSKDFNEIAYSFFFFGGGPNSDIATEPLESKFNKDFVKDLRLNIRTLQSNYREYRDKILKKNQNLSNTPYTGKLKHEGNTANLRIDYQPLDGHSSKLGHYYRHLYQTVKFVDRYSESVVTRKEKYEYLKTLRAQLSNHEQALLYFNSFFVAGRKWYEEGFFLTWKIIKNLPFNLVRGVGIQPEEKFEEEIREKENIEDKDLINARLGELFDWIGG